MALNDFVEFMNEDLEGQSSSMVSFLSKRARLMIGFTIDQLGEYLKILKNSRVEDKVNVQRFLDDISDNLEYFKQEEAAIRENHFNYREESERVDGQLINKEMFSPSDLSQIHAVTSNDKQILKVFLSKDLHVELRDGQEIVISKYQKTPSRSTKRVSATPPRNQGVVPEHQRLGARNDTSSKKKPRGRPS